MLDQWCQYHPLYKATLLTLMENRMNIHKNETRHNVVCKRLDLRIQELEANINFIEKSKEDQIDELQQDYQKQLDDATTMLDSCKLSLQSKDNLLEYEKEKTGRYKNWRKNISSKLKELLE